MKTRSLTETARLMNVSQPAISQALRDLEGQIGMDLFFRTGGRIRPTTEATMFLPEVERLFAQIGSLTFRAAELRDDKAGQIVVAGIPEFSSTVIPAAARQLMEERPRIKISLLSLPTDDVVDKVKRESADLGFTFSPLDESLVGAEPLFETQMCCILPEGHPLAGQASVSAASIAGECIIALSAQTPPGLLLREELRKQRAEALPNIETNSAATALSAVREGIGIAIVDPMAMLCGNHSGVVVVPFEPRVELTACVIFSRHRPIPKVAMRFIQRMREAFRREAETLKSLGIPARGL